MRAMLAARVALVAVALVGCGWFALGARAARDEQQVTRLVASSARLTTAEAATAERRLDAAAAVDPDRNLDILRAEVVQRTGDIPAEVRILQRVVRSEPQDIYGWLLLYYAAYREPALSRYALARVHALAPRVPPPS
jgi:predicted Zn-dependent protease